MKLAAICCVHNGEKYLKRFLSQMIRVCGEENVFILDDRSTDSTKIICQQYKVNYVYNDLPFHGGRSWRTIYKELEKVQPDWVIGFDIDELFEESMEKKLRFLLEGTSPDIQAYSFPMYYMWGDEKHYRVDSWYRDVKVIRVFRYDKERLPADVPRHATAVPEATHKIEYCGHIAVLHFGYMASEDRVKKYKHYRERDKDMIIKGEADYEHFLDTKVKLKEYTP